MKRVVALAVSMAMVVSMVGLVQGASPAQATTMPTLSVPATVLASTSAVQAVSGITVSATGYSTVQTTLRVLHGTLSMTTVTGLTFLSGYGNASSTVSFIATPAATQTALLTLRYTSTTGYQGTDSISYQISPGGAVFNPTTQHFYQFVSGTSATWTAAKTAAHASSFYGLTGYLTTITSSSEQALITSRLPTPSWIGASDNPAQGAVIHHWIWADGPEQGTEFFYGYRNSTTGACVFGTCAAVGGQYNSWGTTSPDNSGGSATSFGESYAQVLGGGTWNDRPAAVSLSGYIIEYGGMAGDSAAPIDAQATNIYVGASVPSSPTSLGATFTGGQTTVAWGAPSNAGVAPVDAYKVEYSADGTNFTTANVNATSPYVISGLAVGNYQIRVSAHNAVGWGSSATTTASVATVATAPTSVTVSQTADQAVVTWSPPTSTGNAAITSYKIEYSTDGTTFSSVSAATSPHTITGLTPGTTYQLRVRAVNAQGDSDASASTSFATWTTPSAPTAISNSHSNNSATITWTSPVSNGGAAVDLYRVEYSTDGVNWTTAGTPATSPFTITGLASGISYQVRVSAHNAAGYGPSDVGSIFTTWSVPSAPTSVVATYGDNKINVEWTAPVSDGGSAVDVYKLEYSLDGINYSTISSSAANPSLLGGLVKGATYRFRVSAHNGAGWGVTSLPVLVESPDVPSAPPALVVSVATTTARVGWNAAADGGSPVTSYVLKYRELGGAWNFTNNATSPAEIKNLKPKTKYEVRVAAINAVGNGLPSSYQFTTIDNAPRPAFSAPVTVDQSGAATELPAYDVPETVAVAPTAGGAGSWTLTPDGGVFTAGDAGFYGSMGGQQLAAPAVSLAPTVTGKGYYIVGADGGVFAFGDASYGGSAAGIQLNAPVTGVGSTCGGGGYYLVAGDGGVFAYGSAEFYGSMAGNHLNAEMIGIVDSCAGDGYWTFAADGGVFAFGDAKFYGSLGGTQHSRRIIGMVAASDGKGYWLIDEDHVVYGFGSVLQS